MGAQPEAKPAGGTGASTGRADLLALRRRIRVAMVVRGMPIERRFNPHQPRDPGGANGGQWIKGPGAAGAVPAAFEGMHRAGFLDKERFRRETGRAIPPGWEDVHIADDLATAKVLVVAKDGKGRTQRMYSAAHIEHQAAAKFARIEALSQHLPALDRALRRDAGDNDAAAALLLIRRLGMRPGSERETYARVPAHGATNLRAGHVQIDGNKVGFDFIGKKGIHIQVSTRDALMARALRSRQEGRGPDDRLFDTDAAKVAAYMRSAGVPDGFLLKDLRTLRANVLALREIEARGDAVPRNKAEFRRWRKAVAESVSAQLGNTPQMALSAYVNPAVFGRWLKDPSWLDITTYP